MHNNELLYVVNIIVQLFFIWQGVSLNSLYQRYTMDCKRQFTVILI